MRERAARPVIRTTMSRSRSRSRTELVWRDGVAGGVCPNASSRRPRRGAAGRAIRTCRAGRPRPPAYATGRDRVSIAGVTDDARAERDDTRITPAGRALAVATVVGGVALLV